MIRANSMRGKGQIDKDAINLRYPIGLSHFYLTGKCSGTGYDV